MKKHIFKTFQQSLTKSSEKESSLGEKTVKGGFWVFSLRIVNRLLQFGRTIILARLLAPHDFGLFGIALLSMQILDTFSQTGFRQALIQRKLEIKGHLDTAWTIGILRGIIIAAILFFAAPGAASFFNAPQAEPILKVIGLSIIFQSLTNIAVIFFEKELQFHKFFLLQFSGTIADLAISIGIAILLRNVWAIVLGRLAGNFISCIVSYLIHPYRPKLHLELQKAKELFSFGKWILGSTILIFIITQGDDLAVSKLLGVVALGFYQIAYKISNLIATELSHPIMKVTFPAYSKLQNNFHKLKEAYIKVLKMTALFSFPMAGLIFAIAKNFTLTVLGEKWLPVVPIIMILVFQSMSRSLRSTLAALTKAIGHPEIETKVASIQVVIILLLIFPGAIFLGLQGVALVMVIQSWITLPLIINKILPKINLNYKAFFKAIGPQFLATAAMTFILFSIQNVLPYNLVTLIIETLVGMLFYLVINLVINKKIIFLIKEIRYYLT